MKNFEAHPLDSTNAKGHGQRTSRERAFFQKFETFGLGQTNWAEILGGILAGSFSYKKRWFLEGE